MIGTRPAIRLRWDAVGSRLDERGRRLFAAAEVRSAGRGGLVIVSKISDSPARRSIAASRISMHAAAEGQVRRAGGGRRSVCENDPGWSRAQAVGRAGDAGRSDATVDLGVEEHGEACRDPDADGPSVSADTVRTQLVKLGSRASRTARRMKARPSRPKRPVRIHQLQSHAAQAEQQPSSPSIPRRRNWSATSRMPELIIVPKAIRSA